MISRKRSVLLAVMVLAAALTPVLSMAQMKNGWRNPFLKDTWYKRYAGVISGNPVVVNLVLYDYFMAGNYYFPEKSDMAELFISRRDTSIDGALTFYGFAQDASFADSTGAKSILYFRGDSLVGKWLGQGGKTVARIALRESYPEGAYPFDVVVHKDSAMLTNNLAGIYSTYKLVSPGEKMKKADAEWFERTIAGDMSDGRRPRDLADYIRTTDSAEFADYKKLMDDSLATAQNFALTLVTQPWYNNHGIVVIKADYYVAIPDVGTRESYYCLDILHKKELHLSDIMNVDTARLKNLLEEDMKAYYAPLHPGYNGPFAAISNDIYVTDFGVTFLFGNNDYRNTPCFFVPYSRLKDMLKPEFRKRMKL